MKKVHSILAFVMVGAIALFSCNSGPSDEEKAKQLEDSMRAVDSITKANAAATPAVNQDSINAANTAKMKADSIKAADSAKKAGNGKKTTTVKPSTKPATKPTKPANSTNVTPAPTPAPAPTPKPTGGFDKKGDDANKGGTGGGFTKKGEEPAKKDGTTPSTTGGFKKK